MAEASSKPFRFELVSPERILLSGEASMVVIPGASGDFGVLSRHAPLLSSLRPGVVTVSLPSSEKKVFFVANGFADVSDDICSIVAEDAVSVTEINKAETEQALKSLQEELVKSAGDAARMETLKNAISVAEEKLKAAA